MRYTLKILMNSCYGKFAQGREKSILEPFSEYKRKRRTEEGKLFENDTMVLYRIEDKEYPRHTNFIFSLYTTARARICLYSLMEKIISKGGDMLYCDTDGIIFKGDIDLDYSNELGGIKLESQVNDIDIQTSKFYKLGNIYKVKGIPKLCQEAFFINHSVTYNKPLKLKEAIRRNQRPNIWLEHKKCHILNYDKGFKTRNGYIIPLKINT